MSTKEPETAELLLRRGIDILDDVDQSAIFQTQKKRDVPAFSRSGEWMLMSTFDIFD